ncbi:F-box protein At3g07870-like [Durio zibethinus]|uniref:F-box protein At3g07870-like n=1 Tax=Durio zibethinus TaxID=66656 RepID=A0A6P5Z5P6_DURZI|nr:F-box protein At3g07870-like [Durio zibethinus]
MGMRGKRQKPPKEDENILKLPSYITVEILSRLPVKTIILCKAVCKAWRNALLDPHFPLIHLAKSSVNLLLCRFPSYWLIEFGKDFRRKKMSKFNDENVHGVGEPSMVGSCNGLLCLSINYPEDFYVWNPVRNEYVTLPMPNIKAGNRLCSYSGFGFCPRTDTYKVIRMVRYGSMPSMAWTGSSNQAMCEVYTLGTNTWRTIEDVPVPHYGGLICKTPFNGAVHWICSFKINDEKFPLWICAFKIEDENWASILLPLPLLEVPGLEFTDQRKELLLSWLQLGVLDNCLAIFDKSQDSLLNIWMMKDYGVRESWIKGWSVESRMPSEIHVPSLLPLKLTKDGDLLMFDDFNKALVCFNPQKSMPCKQKISGLPKISKGIAYVASFISPIKAMKEEC